jgi:hypothetical protein
LVALGRSAVRPPTAEFDARKLIKRFELLAWASTSEQLIDKLAEL